MARTKITLDIVKAHYAIVDNKLIYTTGKHAGKEAGYELPSGYIHVFHPVHNNEYAHRIVWMLDNDSEVPEGMHIDHIDFNRKNNAPSNLQLLTASENCLRKKEKHLYA